MRLILVPVVILSLAGCGQRCADSCAPVATPTPTPTPVAVHTPTTAPIPTAPPVHPADAKAYGGHWYKVIDFKEATSWHQAKEACETAGGYLACIETEAEQKFIAELAKGQYLFLGATDEKEEGVYRWINGAPFTWTCWMEGQPNNYGGEENYLATYDGGDWVDVAVEGQMFWMPTGYLCEWER